MHDLCLSRLQTYRLAARAVHAPCGAAYQGVSPRARTFRADLTPAAAANAAAPLTGLFLTVAGVAQQGRQHTRQALRWVRCQRALRLAKAKRAQRDRLPPVSRRRSAAHFDLLALESVAAALQAATAADAAEYAARAHWFADKAQDVRRWGMPA
jgi:hypothetical protein